MIEHSSHPETTDADHGGVAGPQDRPSEFHEDWTDSAWWSVARLGLIAIGLVAAVVVAVSGIRTSRAEVSASTSTAGLFSAGTIEINQVGRGVELLFDEEKLYPGTFTDACIEVVYTGTIEATLRFHGSRLGGTGLDRYLRFSVWTSDQRCPVANPPSPTLFNGTLDEMWRDHSSYADGIEIGRDMTTGDRVTLVGRAELLDDQDAEGLYTDFALVVEARP